MRNADAALLLQFDGVSTDFGHMVSPVGRKKLARDLGRTGAFSDPAFACYFEDGFPDPVLITHNGVPHSFSETLVTLADLEGGPNVDHYFTFNYLPWLDDNGKVDGILNLAFEVTEQVRAKQEVAKLNEELQATNVQLESATASAGFLLKLSDTLKNCASPLEVQFEATSALGKYLQADRVGYAEVNEDGETATIAKHYAHNVPNPSGTFLMDNYGLE